MRVVNMISKPSASFTLKNNNYTQVSTAVKKANARYVLSMYVNISGGTAKVGPNLQTISSNTRVTQAFTTTTTDPLKVQCLPVSGSPTVTVSDLMLVEESQYQACEDLLDQLEWFDGNTMPLT